MKLFKVADINSNELRMKNTFKFAGKILRNPGILSVQKSDQELSTLSWSFTV